MGYESKLYFVENGLNILSIDMCKMYDDSFYKLFNIHYDKGLFVDMAGMKIPDEAKNYYPGTEHIPDVIIKEDCYGYSLKCCTLDELYKWCKENRKKKDYRRLDLLYKITKEMMKKEKWGDNVQVVHFGH